MQTGIHFRRFLDRKMHVLIIALLTLVIVHLRSHENFPTNPAYVFPLKDFLVHFLGTLFLWEIQFWNFRQVYERKLYEQGFSLNLMLKVLAINLTISILFYAIFAPAVAVWVYQQPLTLYGFVAGLLLSLVFALIINLVYLSLQLYRYWQHKTFNSLSATTTEPAAEVADRVLSHIYIKTGNEQLQLSFLEIAYFYTEHKVVFAITKTGRRLITQYTLAELELLLDPNLFFKLSRQTITHRQSIKSVRKDANYKLRVQLEVNGQPVKEETVSRYKAAEFREWFKKDIHQSV